MLRLAVTTDDQTLERIQEPLAERDIAARHLPSMGRVFSLDKPREDFDVGFVFPPRPMEGGVIDALLAIPWVNNQAAVLTSRNKAGVIARLGRAGLPVPETVLVSNPTDQETLREAYDQIGPPVVVKPNSSTRGIGVARSNDLDSFLGIADYLAVLHEYGPTGDKSFLVQEYLTASADYRAMVIDGNYVGAVERRLPDEAIEAGRWKHNVHRDAVASGVQLSPEYRELVERVAEVLDIAYLGVDLLVTEERVVVTETNARPTVDEAEKYEPAFYDRLAEVIRKTEKSSLTRR